MPPSESVIRQRIDDRISALRASIVRDTAMLDVLLELIADEEPVVTLATIEATAGNPNEEVPYRPRGDEVTEFIRDNPGLPSSDIADRMIAERLTCATRCSIIVTVSRLFSKRVLTRTKDFRYSINEESPSQPEPEQAAAEEEEERIIGDRSIAGTIRRWLKKNPDSTMEQIRQGVIKKIFTHSPKPRQAISQSVGQQVWSKYIVGPVDGKYRLAGKIPSSPNARPRSESGALSTSQMVLQYVKEFPGLKMSEIADQLADKINTSSDDRRGAVYSAASQLKHYSKLEERKQDNTLWLPGEIDSSVPLRKSNAVERAEGAKFEGVLSVFRVAGEEQCQTGS